MPVFFAGMDIFVPVRRERAEALRRPGTGQEAPYLLAVWDTFLHSLQTPAASSCQRGGGDGAVRGEREERAWQKKPARGEKAAFKVWRQGKYGRVKEGTG